MKNKTELETKCKKSAVVPPKLELDWIQRIQANYYFSKLWLETNYCYNLTDEKRKER